MEVDNRLMQLMQAKTCIHCGVDLIRDGNAWVDQQDEDETCPDGAQHAPLLLDGDVVWAICDECQGEGTLGGYPGVYTHEDFADDPDFYEDYMNHRRACEDCDGTGKVRELTEEAEARPEVQEWIRDWYDTENIYRMERMMGA